MTTQTQNEIYKIPTFHDDILLRKIQNCQVGNYNYGYYLMQYRKRISDTRLIAYQNRDKEWSDGFDKDARQMEKRLNIILTQKGFKQ